MIVPVRFNTKNGFAIMRLHYSVDPDKDEAWVKKAQKGMSERGWKREYEISYETFEGKPVYGTFKEELIQEVDHRPGQYVYRGWDFGYHWPACLFAFIDPMDRLVFRKEVLGHDEGVKDFVARIKKLSQEWFSDVYAGERFLDCCDPSGHQPLSGLGDKYKDGKKIAITSVTVLNDYGVHPTSKGTQIVEGLEIIRQRMLMRNDGQYGTVVHPDCKILIDGFKGGYRYDDPKPGQVEKEEPLDDDYYIHLQDCARYIAVNFLELAPTKNVHAESPSENEIMGGKEVSMGEFF